MKKTLLSLLIGLLTALPAMATLSSNEMELNTDLKDQCSPSSNWYQPDDDIGTCFANDPCDPKEITDKDLMKPFCIRFATVLNDKMKQELGTAYCDGTFTKVKDTLNGSYSGRIIYKCSDNRRIALNYDGNFTLDKEICRIKWYCAGFRGEWEKRYERKDSGWFLSACKKLSKDECKKMETMISGMTDEGAKDIKVKYDKGVCIISGFDELDEYGSC